MKYALSFMPVLLLPVAAASEWIVISLEAAVRDSDLIIIGEAVIFNEERLSVGNKLYVRKK